MSESPQKQTLGGVTFRYTPSLQTLLSVECNLCNLRRIKSYKNETFQVLSVLKEYRLSHRQCLVRCQMQFVDGDFVNISEIIKHFFTISRPKERKLAEIGHIMCVM